MGGKVDSVGKVAGNFVAWNGNVVGICVGRVASIGLLVGPFVNCVVGSSKGFCTGDLVGTKEGSSTGSLVGSDVGLHVGL